jgi:Family of unknown function (DUF5681)
MSNAKSKGGSYEIGHSKPPVEHQFKPGKSGNPNGRPKGPGNILKTVAKHAKRKVTVIENGVQRKMPRFDVVVSAMFSKASKGDVPAARLLTNLVLMAKEVEGEDFQSAYTEADLAVMLDEADYQAMLAKLREASDAEGS